MHIRLNKLSDNKHQNAFTIIELLIVVVVIAVLATITTITYRGLRERAVTTAYTSAVDQWEKILDMKIAKDGDLGVAGSTCLGRAGDFLASPGDGFIQDACVSDPVAPTLYDDAFMSSLGLSDTPKGLLPVSVFTLSFGGEQATIKSRGITLSNSTYDSYYILVWYPQVAGQCARGEVYLDEYFEITPGTLTGGSCYLLKYY